ncbi:hypothetical protein BDZ91DRAFT_798506 [Kalaharituber pfeilii]|nr:hypothetical protein BDZ91DRAFT_798506 [Kalaharituber pfeilii]
MVMDLCYRPIADGVARGLLKHRVAATYTFPVGKTPLRHLPSEAEALDGTGTPRWAVQRSRHNSARVLLPDTSAAGGRGWAFLLVHGGTNYMAHDEQAGRKLDRLASAKPGTTSPTGRGPGPGPAVTAAKGSCVDMPLWRRRELAPCVSEEAGRETAVGALEPSQLVAIEAPNPVWYVAVRIDSECKEEIAQGETSVEVSENSNGRASRPPGGLGISIRGVGDGWVVYETTTSTPSKVVVLWFGSRRGRRCGGP